MTSTPRWVLFFTRKIIDTFYSRWIKHLSTNSTFFKTEQRFLVYAMLTFGTTDLCLHRMIYTNNIIPLSRRLLSQKLSEHWDLGISYTVEPASLLCLGACTFASHKLRFVCCRRSWFSPKDHPGWDENEPWIWYDLRLRDYWYYPPGFAEVTVLIGHAVPKL